MHLLRKIILSAAALLLATNAFCQRTAIGTIYVSAYGNCSFSGFGGGAEAGMYNAMGQWKVGLSDANRRASVYNADNIIQGHIGYMHLEFCGDYLWRIVSSHDRRLNFYGGAGLFIGVELIDPAKRWPQNSVFPFAKSNTFLYGVDAQLEFEWFPVRTAPNLALIVGGRLPVNFSSQIRKFNQEVSVGIRYNL